MEEQSVRIILVAAGVVLLLPFYRRFAQWLFENVSRRVAYAVGASTGAALAALRRLTRD